MFAQRVSGPFAGAAMNADLVSHEATFADGMEHKAHIAQHSTAAMAGAFAHRIAARKLVLTHFSGRYVMAGGGVSPLCTFFSPKPPALASRAASRQPTPRTTLPFSIGISSPPLAAPARLSGDSQPQAILPVFY